ncbi:TonB-dependent siderophore receptor [Komagataeibacter oboediens]|nr:TonB-dependent siderophore receptor [Komagataeibacter oboediens]
MPAQPLSVALMRFSQQAGIQVTSDSALLRGINTHGVHGHITIQYALGQLLAGTGLSYSSAGHNTVVLTKAAANITLGPVRVGGTVSRQDPTGPGVGYVATTTMAGTKTDTPITEIPNSIYVVTKQLMQDQQSQSVVEALRYTPGVYSEADGTYGNGSGSTSVGIMQRGFSTTQFVDGLMTNSSSSGEPAFLERIEAVNGPASVMYGQTNPGGMIATGLKKPTDTPLHQVSVGFGNWGRYETAVDLSDKITKSGNLRYRVAAIGVTQGTQVDHVNYHRVGVLPSITWDIDGKTSLSLLGMYMYTPGDGTAYANQEPILGTLIRNSTYPEIPRSHFLGTPNWNEMGEDAEMFEYQFKHEFNRYVTFSQTFRWENSHQTQKTSYLNGIVSPTEEEIATWDNQSQDRTVGLDSRVSGNFSTGPVRHTWVVGSDFRQYGSGGNSVFDFTSFPLVDVYNPRPNYVPCYNMNSSKCENYGVSSKYSYFQEGVYFQDQIKWKGLSVLLGGREDWVNFSGNYGSESTIGSYPASSNYTKYAPQPRHAFTWRAGLIYKFKFGLSPYFSYATSFIPQTSTDWRGTPFAPLTGNQLEAGLKYKVPNKDILITASAFRINEDHYLISDLVHTGYSSDGGHVRSQGFEISANANIMRDLRMVASYSYTDVRFAKTNLTEQRFNPYTSSYYGNLISEQGMSVPQVPRNMASVFFDYTLPRNIFKGFGLNWGLRYIGYTYADEVESFKTKPYTLFDIGAHYDFGNMLPTLKGLKAQMAISNLTNKYYVTSCSTFNCFVGQGRRVYGNLTYNW